VTAATTVSYSMRKLTARMYLRACRREQVARPPSSWCE